MPTFKEQSHEFSKWFCKECYSKWEQSLTKQEKSSLFDFVWDWGCVLCPKAIENAQEAAGLRITKEMRRGNFQNVPYIRGKEYVRVWERWDGVPSLCDMQLELIMATGERMSS